MEQIKKIDAVASSEVIVIDGKSNGAAADIDHNPVVVDGKLRKCNGPRRSSWTVEEDNILGEAVQRYGGKSWKKIAECLPGRTDIKCLHRWQKVLIPDLIKGPWTKQEDILLTELVGKFNNNERKKWSKIANELPGRIGKQCRERWHNHLKPDIKKAAWTDEEENILIKAHAEYGNKWSMIATFLHGRTENSVKNHWNCSMKRRHVDVGNNEKAKKCSNEEWSGLCYKAIDDDVNVANIYLSSYQPKGCCTSISSYIKESTTIFLRSFKALLRSRARSFQEPSIFSRKPPKHTSDKDF